MEQDYMVQENYYELIWNILHKNKEEKIILVCREHDSRRFGSEKSALEFFEKHKNDLDKTNFELWHHTSKYLGGNTKEDYIF